MLDDPSVGEEVRQASNTLLREGAQKLEAKLLFLRHAFGSAGMSDSVADIHEAKRVIEKYAAHYKPELSWDIQTAHFTNFHVRMLMQLVLLAIDSLPRGGTIAIRITDHESKPAIALHCIAKNDRPGIEPTITLKPEIMAVVEQKVDEHAWEARSIHANFASHVATQLSTRITATQLNPREVIFAANGLAPVADINREGLS
ncbi:MAG: histidine phosphotransferase family protein [Pseudomonadota bacterium]